MDFYANISTELSLEKKIKYLQENFLKDISRPKIIEMAINEFYKNTIKKNQQ